ncbi:hypothetical protein FH608_023900 [Nonomuraea phyllanthi]|uniref:Uncharacterized protein n=1 Tax=Nonomuraea phyllanthi TaxID=2219224 RepID=A0A5C4WB61_9ACTN|nr:hypothetical protein [Nonomuraea phyllanthi]KAB8192553.1 hypothetical protein FH608_023900 [Nonomuraea phyllanthi]QFY08032.1 hypothetical protein GBF35_16300 [Nonomuraea phyllanthi]
MGQLETMAETHYTRTSIEAREAIDKLTYAAESGKGLACEDLARLAVTQFACGWWQQVMDLINGEGLDAAEAVMRIRREAEQHLLTGSPIRYGDLFSQAMAQARRQAAQGFLATTRSLADALAGPAAPASHAAK